MVSAHAYPTFKLSDAVSLLAKTAAREQKLGLVSGNPLLSGNPLPYLSLAKPDSSKAECSTEKRLPVGGAFMPNVFDLSHLPKKLN